MPDYDDDYVSLEFSKGSNEDQIDQIQSTCAKTTEQLVAAYEMMPDLRVLKPYSEKEARDIEQALRGDYQNYHQRKKDIVQLPTSQAFKERLEKSVFDKMNIESHALKYRFLAPFLVKAELNPGLAFSEAFLTLVHIITFISVSTNGLNVITTIIGCCSIFALLSILQFWYGISRYPSVWNRFVPASLRGAAVDRNFKQIKDICGYHHNGHDQMNSQIIPFVITLPFTILFHAVAFLVTAIYSLLKIMTIDLKETRFPDPVITSIFLSNAVVSSLWAVGGTFGIVFATLTIYFNQKAYNSLLFKKDLKSFCMSLVFGNLLIVDSKATPVVSEIPLTKKTTEVDLESGMQKVNPTPTCEEGLQQSRPTLPPVQYLPPLLGASTSSSTNSFADKDMAPQNYTSVVSHKIIVVQDGREQIATNPVQESPAEIFDDETISQHSNESLQHIGTVNSTSQHLAKNEDSDNGGPKDQNVDQEEIKMEKLEHSKTAARKGILGLSRRMFSSPRTKNNRKKGYAAEKIFDDVISVELFNESNVHLDMENHPGTVEWRNTLIESTERFKIKTYTLRKHKWVMSKMHGKSFFVKEDGNRRRKLNRKEVKVYCKRFHDKHVHVNSQIHGILDDLKDLKKNISTSKSQSINQSTSKSEVTKFSFTNLPSQVNHKSNTLRKAASKDGQGKKNFTMSDAEYKTPKSEGADTAKESLEGSKDSSVSTLTQSLADPEQPDDAKSGLCISEITEKIMQPNGDSSSLQETIDGLLKCGGWAENINALKETAPIEKNDSLVDEQPQTEDTENPVKNDENDEGGVPGSHRGNSTTLKQKPIWHNFIDPEIFKQQDSKKKKQEEESFWRGDLEEKESEQTREDRLESNEITVNQPKRIIPILKKSSSHNLKLKDDESRDQQSDRHNEVTDNGRCGVDNLREFDFLDFSNPKTVVKNSQIESPEMDTATSKSGHQKTTTAGLNFGTECGAFAGMSDACSELTGATTEQRDLKLIGSNHVS